ncbi:unnamed protein product [Gongylonema pulchrum]|uniref:DUF1292 domain-containing protein n=1 Tax=Gongylonema pulchrum TaxID=637853 RepID=A0A183DXR5_9BILA|nr:unnamed protein product [Gongylonema pulchrum]
MTASSCECRSEQGNNTTDEFLPAEETEWKTFIGSDGSEYLIMLFKDQQNSDEQSNDVSLIDDGNASDEEVYSYES